MIYGEARLFNKTSIKVQLLSILIWNVSIVSFPESKNLMFSINSFSLKIDKTTYQWALLF